MTREREVAVIRARLAKIETMRTRATYPRRLRELDAERAGLLRRFAKLQRRRVTPETLIGMVSVLSAAAMGRFAVSDCVETVQQMLDQGIFRWVPGEDRVEVPCVPLTADGEVVH